MEIFLKSISGLHQGYLMMIVKNIPFKFLSTQFDHSWIGWLMQKKWISLIIQFSNVF